MKYLVLILVYLGLILCFSISCKNNSAAETVGNENAEFHVNYSISDTIDVKTRLAALTDTSKLSRFSKEIQAFKHSDSLIVPKHGQVLFIGSSTIRKWKTLQSDFQPIPVINRGFGGSTLAEVCRYANDIVIPYAPKKIFLYEGDNDLANNDLSVKSWILIVDIFADMIQYYLPETKIYIISIKPSPARLQFQTKFNEANSQLKRYADSTKSVTYVDICSAMTDDNGVVNSDLFLKDKLHLNGAGYKLWTSILKKYVAE